MLDAASIISDPDFAEAASYTIRPGGYYTDDGGEWVQGTPVTAPITVVSWPPSDAEMKTLSDGVARLTSARKFLVASTSIESLRIDSDQRSDSDIITYQEVEWRVHNVDAWYKFGFSEIMAIRVDT